MRMINASRIGRAPIIAGMPYALAGDSSLRYALTVNGEPWTDYAQDIAVEFSGDTGASRLTFTSGEPMDGLAHSPTVLQLAIGDAPLRDYFVGTLWKPMPDPPTWSSKATALGPFALMTEQSFGEQVTYRGRSLASCLYDIARRASFTTGSIRVERGGKKVTEQTFSEDVKLSEGATGLCDPADFVMTDLPGGGRVFMPRPAAGASGRAGAIYTPSDYDTFSVDDRYDGYYAKVVVYRKGTEGNYEVRSERKVPNRGTQRVLPRRIYYVPEFLGDQGEADQASYDLAKRLASGEVKFGVDGLAPDPERARYDQITVSREVERRDGIYLETYDASIDESLTLAIGDDPKMTLAGFGVLKESRKVGRPRIRVETVSPGVIEL